MKKLNGKDIIRVMTIPSMYNGGCVVVYAVGGKAYRLPAEVVMQMAHEFVFVPKLKKVHEHLSIDWAASKVLGGIKP